VEGKTPFGRSRRRREGTRLILSKIGERGMDLPVSGQG
jgi:hypothetical protein